LVDRKKNDLTEIQGKGFTEEKWEEHREWG